MDTNNFWDFFFGLSLACIALRGVSCFLPSAACFFGYQHTFSSVFEHLVSDLVIRGLCMKVCCSKRVDGWMGFGSLPLVSFASVYVVMREIPFFMNNVATNNFVPWCPVNCDSLWLSTDTALLEYDWIGQLLRVVYACCWTVLLTPHISLLPARHVHASKPKE
ncbi:hypothetical protein HBI04_047140 [Parastagonospora nodorum]|nr:hypothetical protein HBI03_171340 [Parastagonospora nodorum]KAH4280690.1 hypothetical protein HBI04_047140 [Parastagonospora nodorum]